MKNLTEINRERTALVDMALRKIEENYERGVGYTAVDLAIMSGNLIPADIFARSLARGYKDIIKRGNMPYCRYNIFGWLRCRIGEEETTLTYKVYDEGGNLIKTYKRTKRLLKAFID